ncbi:MAG: hypothetical protein V5A18_10615 [Haloarculaceae archaeon]
MLRSIGIDPDAVADETVRIRLQAVLDAGDGDRREFEPAVADRALVGAFIPPDVAARSEEQCETPGNEFTELEEAVSYEQK